MGHGGKRTGAGRPKGPTAATINKILERERLRQIVCAELEPMIRAQIAHAKGVSYLVLRNPDGTFTRATNAAQIDAACKAGAQAVRIFTQAPNTAAFTDLLNRALDKPADQIQLTGEEGGPVVHTFRWQT
jgi:hypothetical protein